MIFGIMIPKRNMFLRVADYRVFDHKGELAAIQSGQALDKKCDDKTCRCSQQNGISKYYGESCDLTATSCDGNPCQNGGACTSMIVASNNNQVFFNKIFEK